MLSRPARYPQQKQPRPHCVSGGFCGRNRPQAAKTAVLLLQGPGTRAGTAPPDKIVPGELTQKNW